MCTSNACDQGRKPCPTPQACELPIQFADEEKEPVIFSLIGWVLAAFVAVLAVSFIAGLLA